MNFGIIYLNAWVFIAQGKNSREGNLIGSVNSTFSTPGFACSNELISDSNAKS
jgi:hypothetical protein